MDQNNADSTILSLADFADVPAMDIMQKADYFSSFLKDIEDRKHLQYRRIALEGSAPTRTVRDAYTGKTREMIYLASNDYLNLCNHPKVIKAGIEALEQYGAGAGSVPLLGGTIDLHIELENKIASLKRCESAIIYTSGFGSNAGSLLTMLNKKDVAIVDMLAHASLIDGCRNTNLKPFLHNDMKSLEEVLKNVKDKYRTKIIVVDGVYSMDGDIVPLHSVIELARKYNAYILMDDAHATGVIGKNGRGTAEHFGLEGEIDMVAGTFSKTLGVVGGFIAAKKELVEMLRYLSRTYVFSTAMTPQSAGSLIAAIDVIENEPVLRKKLWENIHYFKTNLQSLGFDLGNSETAIFPIIIGNDLKVKEVCRILHERDIYVNPVLYPAVKKKAARIRLSIMAGHTKEQLDNVLNALEDINKEHKIAKPEYAHII